MTLHIHRDVEQRTEEWAALRRGIVTASNVRALLAVSSPGAGEYECPRCKSAPTHPCISLSRKTPTPIKTYHDERAAIAVEEGSTAPPVITVADNDTSRGLTALLVAERVTGFTEDTPMNSDMWRGIDCEPIARDLYSGHYHQAEECGFMVWTEQKWTLGYSPDGLVGTDGLLEVKAPRAKAHLATILADEVPAQHMPQLQAGLLVSGRAWIDFVSFCGGMPLFVKRVEPDPVWHAAITAAVAKFEETAAAMVADYRAKTKHMPATERVEYGVELKLA